MHLFLQICQLVEGMIDVIKAIFVFFNKTKFETWDI